MSHHARLVWSALLALAIQALATPAHADEQPRAVFALIVGSNISVDAELAPLRYADDDAARYLDFFRLLGARTYLLSRLDDNTRRLHPQAAAEAGLPRRAEFERAVGQLAADVEQARARGLATVIYFAFAGHGSVRNGQGYLTLEDSRLTGKDLSEQFIARTNAGSYHLIVDACDSYLLAFTRGPGGTRRPIADTPLAEDIGELAKNPRVGLLLSSSSARESHEWEGFQSGVFSHEVRSGLYGAADADGDGQVTYREIAAFVALANASIPNERFRPQVHARAPGGGEVLADLRRASRRSVTIDGTHAGHYVLEDANGVRLADAHNGPTQDVRLIRPGLSGPAFLRRVDDGKEFLLPHDAGDGDLAIASLTPEAARSQTRGAAHESFNRAFLLPFDRSVVEGYREALLPANDAPAPRRSRLRPALGGSAIALGALSLGAGAALSLSSAALARDHVAGESQAQIGDRNDRIGARNAYAATGYALGGALVATGLVILLWPDSPAKIKLGGAAAGGVGATLAARF